MKISVLSTPPSAAQRCRKGSPTRFDGNMSDWPRNWLFPMDGFSEVAGETLGELMAATIEGHDRWVLFPIDGFRL